MAPRGASAELEGLTGVWAAVKYLVSVGSANTDLIKAHARCAPIQAVQMCYPTASLPVTWASSQYLLGRSGERGNISSKWIQFWQCAPAM